MAITYDQLPVVTGYRLTDGSYVEPRRPVLYCDQCDQEFSADPGDYWYMADAERQPFVCFACDTPLRLVTRRIVREDWPL